MNAQEVGMILDMITAHYWQTPKTAIRDQELMVRTWTKALEDIPLQPHVELALDDWFKTEKWPPQASELRERALDLGGPTPTMIAEAEAWRRESEFYQQLRAERRARGIGPGEDSSDEVGAEERARVQDFRRAVRLELGLEPYKPKALRAVI